ncbi:MAG: dihydrofolate reductase [Candidatus Komeilibacteria bacterium]|nr:dihydrofolate reductase [Candidatus Komeilibacteria bacterium]
MKITLWMAASLNGIIATTNNGEDFLSDKNWWEFIKTVTKTSCLVWGRKTYQVVSGCDKRKKNSLKGITKIIVSKNNKLKLPADYLLATSPKQAIALAAKLGFKEIILVGGSTNNSAFAASNLIDEVIINFEGVIVGQGLPIFKPAKFLLPLQLKTIKKISSNIIQLHYKVKK